MAARKRKTRQVWNEPGHAHELTFSCYHRYRFLDRPRTREWFICALQLVRQRSPIELWAYVIMPEHAHVLVYPSGSGCDVSAVLKTIKQSVARRAVAWLREQAPAWLERLRVTWPSGRVEYRFWQQGGGYDRNLWREDAVWTAIEYIHANPVRRGLCATPTDWEWSSARWYAGLRPVPLELDGPPPMATPAQWTRRSHGT